MKHLLAALMGVALATPAFADTPWEKPFAVRDAHGAHMGRLFGTPGGLLGVQLRIAKQRYLVELDTAVPMTDATPGRPEREGSTP